MIDLDTPISIRDVAAVLRTTPTTLHHLLAEQPPQIFGLRPAPERWSVNEVIGHLIEADRIAFAGRIERILRVDQPPLDPWDVDGIVAQRCDRIKEVNELLDELAAKRIVYAQFVIQLRPEQLKRSGLHPQAGPLRVSDIVYEWAYHDFDHLKQVMDIIQTFVWPKMGETMRAALSC